MTLQELLLNGLALGGGAVVAWARTRRALHMWQMDSYINSRYAKWLFSKPFERYLEIPLTGIALGCWLVGTLAPYPSSVIAPAVWLAACLGLVLRKDPTPVKKPLDMTARARKTLLAARTLVILVAIAGLMLKAGLLGAIVLMHASPWLVLAANVILIPWRKAVNRGFVRQAADKLAGLNPVIVGVAGSYGKTSTKYFIDVLIASTRKTLKSPGNYNTLLGITRVVNEMLTAEHEVFIAEMGAYKRGEVKEIADLVHPQIGIITSIGPEHYERFLSMDNIEATNYELIEALPAGGLAVFNGDNEHCRKLAGRTKHTRVALYGLEKRPDLDLWAESIQHSAAGLEFEIVLKDGRRATATTRIVGRHNVLNILGAVRIAQEVGIPLETIVSAISKLEPAPHRLEVKQGNGGTIIIDDSYNSNPIGATEALRVLSQFRPGRRILVTPGMIELGVLHYQENEKLGRVAAECADFVILVGPEQTKPLADGLRNAGFPEASLRIIKDLSETAGIFQSMLRPGDAILFENDLPDLYTEK